MILAQCAAKRARHHRHVAAGACTHQTPNAEAGQATGWRQ